MSKTALREHLLERMVVNMEYELTLAYNKEIRKIFSKNTLSQCFRFNKAAINVLHQGVLDSLGIKSMSEIGGTDRGFKTLLKQHIKNAWGNNAKPKELQNKFWDLFEKRYRLVYGENYIFTNTAFSSIRENLNGFVENYIKNHTNYSGRRKPRFKDVDFDHGITNTDIGALGMGGSIMSYGYSGTSGMTIEEFNKRVEPILKKNLSAGMESLKFDTLDLKLLGFKGDPRATTKARLLNIALNWEQNFNPDGTFKAGMGVVVTPISKARNSEQAKLERREISLLQTAITKTLKELDIPLPELEGSSSARDKAEQVVEDNLFDGLDKRFETKPKRKKVKTKSKTKVSDKANPKVNIPGITGGKSARFVKNKATKTTGSDYNYTELITYINRRLHAKLQKNMKSPALNYRTGRFAQSASVVGVQMTPKGYPSISYTYQQNPYKIFEKGGPLPWATPQRDPRLLLEKSIREIAAEKAVGRFYLRRV